MLYCNGSNSNSSVIQITTLPLRLNMIPMLSIANRRGRKKHVEFFPSRYFRTWHTKRYLMSPLTCHVYSVVNIRRYIRWATSVINRSFKSRNVWPLCRRPCTTKRLSEIVRPLLTTGPKQRNETMHLPMSRTIVNTRDRVVYSQAHKN